MSLNRYCIVVAGSKGLTRLDTNGAILKHFVIKSETFTWFYPHGYMCQTFFFVI